MRKFFILILFCSFLSCSSNDNLPKNTIVYGEYEIPIKTAAGAPLETIIDIDGNDREKLIFNYHLFTFTDTEKSELIATPEPPYIVYIAITENLFGKKIDMRNPELLENGSKIYLITRIVGEMGIGYILASDGERTGTHRGDIETGTFQLDYKDGKCTLVIDAELRDGTLFSCRYEGELVTSGMDSVFQQFMEL